MPANAARHQFRHFKTLIVLVVAMTGSTIFLYWLGRLAPVTPLRAKTPAAWNQILVRANGPRTDEGFYHLKIDQQGRVSESSAWGGQRYAQNSEGTIHLLVACDAPDTKLTPTQTAALSRTIADLRKTYGIPSDHIRVAQSAQTANFGDQISF
ncbi:MAG TPA: hypothetical protein VMV94_16850 [Phycisphaerae bacterium]|nr:hypothetical protein [Phycisphaerae bacterium]